MGKYKIQNTKQIQNSKHKINNVPCVIVMKIGIVPVMMPIPLTPFPMGRGRSCKERGRSPLSKTSPLSYQERGRGEQLSYLKSIYSMISSIRK